MRAIAEYRPMNLRSTAAAAVLLFGLLHCSLASAGRQHASGAASSSPTVQRNGVAEVTLRADHAYSNPFNSVEVDANITSPDGTRQTVPAFWDGGSVWRFRYSSDHAGAYPYSVRCSDPTEKALNSFGGVITVLADYHGANPLYTHGALRVSVDHRHLEHADSAPFLWLADTWWKGLSKRLTWQGFQQLTADRRNKGFSVVQIVCGPYPDEGLFEPRWENEGGKPYVSHDFSTVNPAYFTYSDRRIRHLADSGIVPAIVGGWGRGGSLEAIGLPGYKRHWRNLIAHYAAYPVVWIIGGEAGGPDWTELARYVRQIDPFHRLITMHPGSSSRAAVTDESVLDFDMLQTGHGDWSAALGAIPQIRAALARKPTMPGLVGEACYEGHMQSAFEDVERYLFWGCMLSGAAGHTYGAAGVWHAAIEGDPGITPVYDATTWKVGMEFAGSKQVGIAKRLLEQYPWSHCEPHPEWVDADSFAVGIPGQLRIIYQPRRGVYNWTGIVVRQLEMDVPYHAFYFNPTDGKRYDLGRFIRKGVPGRPFESAEGQALFEDHFDRPDGDVGSAWTRVGTPEHLEQGHLIGSKGMLSLVRKSFGADLVVGVNAHRDAEAGVILRYQNADNYLVGLYSPLFKAIYLHDRHNGVWGDQLGRIDVSDIGPNFRLTMAAKGASAALEISDGVRTYYTPVVRIAPTISVAGSAPNENGTAGLWMYQIGERQVFDNFQLHAVGRIAQPDGGGMSAPTIYRSDVFHAPDLPSPRDWVLVLERTKP